MFYTLPFFVFVLWVDVGGGGYCDVKVGRDYPPPIDLDLDLGSLDENAYRLIKYEFSEDVLRLPTIQVIPRDSMFTHLTQCSAARVQ